MSITGIPNFRMSETGVKNIHSENSRVTNESNLPKSQQTAEFHHKNYTLYGFDIIIYILINESGMDYFFSLNLAISDLVF